MNKSFYAVAAMIFAVGCGADVQGACENYINANNGCIEEAFGDATIPSGATLDAAEFCAAYDGYKGSEAKSAANQLQCYADGIAAVDCSDPATYGQGIIDALAACPLE